MAAGAEIKRLRGTISAERAASLIGVRSMRLRKWEERNTDPKDTGDIRAVENYFGCRLQDLKNLEHVEWHERARPDEVNEVGPDYDFYKDKYIKILERQLHEKDEVILAINRKLTTIETSLGEAKRNQLVMYSVHVAFQQAVLPLVAGNRRKAIEKEVAEKAIELLAKYQQEGI